MQYAIIYVQFIVGSYQRTLVYFFVFYAAINDYYKIAKKRKPGSGSQDSGSSNSQRCPTRSGSRSSTEQPQFSRESTQEAPSSSRQRVTETSTEHNLPPADPVSEQSDTDRADGGVEIIDEVPNLDIFGSLSMAHETGKGTKLTLFARDSEGLQWSSTYQRCFEHRFPSSTHSGHLFKRTNVPQPSTAIDRLLGSLGGS